jgi:hypothetical protein
MNDFEKIIKLFVDNGITKVNIKKDSEFYMNLNNYIIDTFDYLEMIAYDNFNYEPSMYKKINFMGIEFIVV